MHAASVYPEPGSNSPKRCTTLRSRLLSEGLTTRTSLSRISCHSSVVKVQRPRRDGPRRRRRMMRLGGRGVKPRGAGGSGVRTTPCDLGLRPRDGEWYGGSVGLSNVDSSSVRPRTSSRAMTPRPATARVGHVRWPLVDPPQAGQDGFGRFVPNAPQVSTGHAQTWPVVRDRAW